MWGNHFELLVFKSSTTFFFLPSPPLPSVPPVSSPLLLPSPPLPPFFFLSFVSFVHLSPMVECTSSVPPRPHYFRWSTASLVPAMGFKEELLVTEPRHSGCGWASQSPSLRFFKVSPRSLLPTVSRMTHCMIASSWVPPSRPSAPHPSLHSSQRNLFSNTFFKSCQFSFRFPLWICHPIPHRIHDFLHLPLAPSFHLQPLSSYCQSVPCTGQTHSPLRAFARVCSSP